MDKAILVESDYKDGAKLIQELDKRNFNVHSALWFYNSEAEQWRLIIASTLVEKLGHKEVYTKVKSVIDTMEKPFDITLLNISIVNSSDFLIKLLGSAIKTSSDSLTSIRFSKNTINNSYIEDAYIYRLQ